MSVDKLRDEQREYTLRIEEVLAGMDRVLTDLNKRVVVLEQQMRSGARPVNGDDSTAERLKTVEEQISTMGFVLNDLMGERR
jgi:hypothetical protein